MSVFSSICKSHDNDPIDVAYSYVEPTIRLWVECDEDGQESTTYLTLKQAYHLIDLIQTAIDRAVE